MANKDASPPVKFFERGSDVGSKPTFGDSYRNSIKVMPLPFSEFQEMGRLYALGVGKKSRR